MWEILLLLVTVVLVYKWFGVKPKNFPPGPSAIPLFGSVFFESRKNFHLSLERMREKYGPIIGLMFGPRPAVAVCGPDLVMEVFRREDFTARPSLIKSFGRKNEGVMFANGDHWRQQRRFTMRHLRDFGFGKSTVANMVEQEVEEFCAQRLKGNTVVEGSGLFNTSAINILWAMIAGTRLSYSDKKFKVLLTHLEQLFRSGNVTGGIINTVPGLRKFLSLFYESQTDRMEAELADFYRETIDQHRATRSEIDRDFLDVYLSEIDNSARHKSFSPETLNEVLRDLFAAGAESSANTISFAIMYFLIHPEWQEKLYQEIDQVLQGRAPTYEDRLNLPLVEAYLCETQRSNTIAPLSVPHATTKDTTLAGYFLPKDTFVVISIWALLQDKKHWGDPDKFRPERFLSPEGAFVKDPYMLLFGAGSRFCLGESLARSFVFLFFVSLIQRYKFTLPAGHSSPSTTCKSGFTTAPQQYFVNLQHR